MELALAGCCLLGAFFAQSTVPMQLRVGYSREGRPIDGYSLGSGPATADNSGYPARPFVAYPVTGDFAQWCDDLGIPTVEVELSDHFDPEFDRNLAGAEAALQEVVARYQSY